MPSVVVETVCPLPIPNPARLVMDPPGASGADKKRNKLGYSRTSVACVHCRRRKIRCLVSADDSEGRCENCIRLRKDCQFYPVDQQPPIDRKSRPGMKMENTPTSSTDPSISSSSPPAVFAGGGSIDPNDIYSYQVSMQSTATTPEMSATAFHPSGFPVAAPMRAFSTTNPSGIPQPELVPSQTIDPNATWDPTGPHPSMGAPSQVVWTPRGQMLAAQTHHSQIATSPIAPGVPHPQMLSPVSAAAPYTVQPDGTLWPGAPQRAMTTIPSQVDIYHPGFAPNITPELKRSVASPIVTGSQQSSLQSPPTSPGHHSHITQMQVPVNFPPGATMAFQPPPPQQQQWNNMTAVPMADGSYATVFTTPEHFPMGPHPATGP